MENMHVELPWIKVAMGSANNHVVEAVQCLRKMFDGHKQTAETNETVAAQTFHRNLDCPVRHSAAHMHN